MNLTIPRVFLEKNKPRTQKREITENWKMQKKLIPNNVTTRKAIRKYGALHSKISSKSVKNHDSVVALKIRILQMEVDSKIHSISFIVKKCKLVRAVNTL